MLDADLPIDELTDAYAKWRETKGGNVDQILALMADTIEMRSVLDPAVPHELAGTHRDIAGARAYFQSLTADWDMIDYPQEKIVADGDTVVWIGRCAWRNKHTGQEIDTPKVDIWTFRDGKAVGFFEMFDSLAFAKTAALI